MTRIRCVLTFCWAFSVICSRTAGQALFNCYDAGECYRSINIGNWNIYGAENCLQECQQHPECYYFTYYELDRECLGFLTCEEFSQETCEQCFSGQRDCDELQCGVSGRCDGSFLDELLVSSAAECNEECRLNGDCVWFTYDSDNSACLLFATCPFIDDRCGTCTSGEKLCTPDVDVDTTENLTVLVIGGETREDGNGVFVSNVELLDPSDLDAQCQEFRDYPLGVRSATSTIFQDQILVCGGSDGYFKSDCFAYNFTVGLWHQIESMSVLRGYHHSSLIGDVWLISGGDNLYSTTSYTSEVFDGVRFSPGPELPISLSGHCQVTLNATHVLFADATYSGDVFLLDWQQETWTQIASVPIIRDYPACGVALSYPAGLQVVVAGDGTSDIFSLDTLTWRPGPALQPATGRLSSAQVGDTFMVLGGCPFVAGATDCTSTLGEIFLFDVEDEVFRRQNQTLDISRQFATAVAAVDEKYNVSC